MKPIKPPFPFPSEWAKLGSNSLKIQELWTIPSQTSFFYNCGNLNDFSQATKTAPEGLNQTNSDQIILNKEIEDPYEDSLLLLDQNWAERLSKTLYRIESKGLKLPKKKHKKRRGKKAKQNLINPL